MANKKISDSVVFVPATTLDNTATGFTGMAAYVDDAGALSNVAVPPSLFSLDNILGIDDTAINKDIVFSDGGFNQMTINKDSISRNNGGAFTWYGSGLQSISSNVVSASDAIQVLTSNGGGANSSILIHSRSPGTGKLKLKTETNIQVDLPIAPTVGQVLSAKNISGDIEWAVEVTIPKRKFEITSPQPAGIGAADGDIVYFGTGTTVLGKLYYFDGTDWLGTDASAGVGAGALGLLGIALGTTPATDGMLIRGMVTLEHDPGTIGNTLYMAPAGALGLITDTIPAVSGETVRVVGYCMDSANYQIWFNPSSTTIEIL